MTYNKKSVEDIDVAGKKVLVRCDFNVPMKDGVITDDKRIVGALPTIKYLLDHNAAVILCSHMGRPKGEFNMKYSLAPVAKRLTELLGQNVELASDVIGPDAKAKAASLKPGQAMLLENVRFHAEEEKNDPAFAKELASMAEIYVNDAFGTAHRAHASTAGVADYLPAVCGFLIRKEVEIMGKALADPCLLYTSRNGVGDISIKSMDLLMMYWEPGVMDIQDSPHLFSLAVAGNTPNVRITIRDNQGNEARKPKNIAHNPLELD